LNIKSNIYILENISLKLSKEKAKIKFKDKFSTNTVIMQTIKLCKNTKIY